MKPGRTGAVRQVTRRVVAIAIAAVVLFVSLPSAIHIPTSHAAIPSGTIGVTAVGLRDDSIRRQQLDAIKSEGFQSVRLIVEWPLIEPAPGQFDWASTDAQVMDAFDRNLAILAVVTYTPAWAATPEGRNFLHPAPADPNTFANFVQIAAERYRGVIRNWEIWNEPNIVQSFAPEPDVALYSEMLSKAYAAIKSVDPASVVISGGTSPAVDGPGSIAPAAFVYGLLARGAANYLDGIGMHPYSSPNLLSTQTEPYSSKQAIEHVTNLMNYLGVRNKQLWFTEFGASTALTPQTTELDASGQGVGVSETRQAEILVDAIEYLRSLPNGGPIFVFDHRDYQPDGRRVEYTYGLVRHDFSPKPSLDAVKRLLAPA